MRPFSLARRVAAGIVIGIAIGFLAAFLIDNVILAALLGSLAALAIADLEDVRTTIVVGFITGAGASLAMVVGQGPVLDLPACPAQPLRIILHVLVTTTVCGLVCALYGFIMGKLKVLYDEGRGPFF